MKSSGYLSLVASSISLFYYAHYTHGAEFELATLDTYLSPALLEPDSPSSANPQPVRLPVFTTTWALAGVESHYQYRNDFDPSSYATFHLASDLYVARFQLEASYTQRAVLALDSESDATLVPKQRYRLAFAYYWGNLKRNARERSSIQDANAPAPVPEDMRIFLGWIGDRRRDASFVNEIFLDMSVKLPAGELIERSSKLTQVHSGAIYAFQPETHDQFLGYEFRATLHTWGKRSALRFATGLSYARSADHWSWGSYHNHLVLSVPSFLPRSFVEIGAAATRDFRRDRWNYQLIATAKLDCFSKVFLPDD